MGGITSRMSSSSWIPINSQATTTTSNQSRKTSSFYGLGNNFILCSQNQKNEVLESKTKNPIEIFHAQYEAAVQEPRLIDDSGWYSNPPYKKMLKIDMLPKLDLNYMLCSHRHRKRIVERGFRNECQFENQVSGIMDYLKQKHWYIAIDE